MCILYFEKCALQLISKYLIIFNLCPYDTCKQRPNHPNKNILLQLISEYLIIFNLCPYDTCKQRPNHPNKNIPFFYHSFNKLHWNAHLVYNWYLNSLSLFFSKKRKRKKETHKICFNCTGNKCLTYNNKNGSNINLQLGIIICHTLT